MPTLDQIKKLELRRKELDSKVFSPMKGLSEQEIEELYNSFASKYGDCEAPKEVSAHHGSWILVGQYPATNAYCGTFSKFKICPRVELHGQAGFDGVSHAGEVFVRKIYWSCGSPKCSVCLHRGYARREADHIAQRIEKASKGFIDAKGVKHMGLGTAYHVVVSPPESDWDLAEFHNERFRAKVKKLLYEVGAVGGVTIFHGFAYADYRESIEKGVLMGWRWRPHTHNILFITGGYGKCRTCSKYVKRFRARSGKVIEQHGSEIVCTGCDGFEARVRRSYAKNGYIIKCLDERTTIFGTAWYALEHCAIKVTS